MLEAAEPPLSLKHPCVPFATQAPTRTVATFLEPALNGNSQTYASKHARHSTAVTIIYIVTIFVSGVPLSSK